MRAGLLRDIIDFLEPEETQGATGFVKKEYKSVYTCKAYRKKNSVILDDEMNASESFKETVMIFQVRYHPVIKENMHIRFNGSEYDIKLIDPQVDNTYLITCKKVND